MPIILTSNEKILSGYDWKDIEGEQYHYPNQYRNLITPGTPFVYYRGIHRISGGPGEMEYVGSGEIGEVWLDPDTEDLPKGKRNWYCSIENFIPFPSPVLAKSGEETIETVDHPQNHWRRAVRSVTTSQQQEILRRAGLLAAIESQKEAKTNIIQNIERDAVPIIGSVIKPRPTRSENSDGENFSTGYSKQSKITGEAGERAVLKYLRENFASISKLRWVAGEGETPGWDIEYIDTHDELIRIEVKSTQSKTISAVELTANEWQAAEAHGDNYQLALVASCLTPEPKIQFVRNPFAVSQKGHIKLKPVRFQLSW